MRYSVFFSEIEGNQGAAEFLRSNPHVALLPALGLLGLIAAGKHTHLQWRAGLTSRFLQRLVFSV